MNRIPMINGDEYDVILYKKQYSFRSKQRSKIKRGYRRRERRISKQLLRSLENKNDE